ncbi:MAG: M28 family peptidase [Pedosphaera sp.]|nr:M28 family peptidase [Pedosphaera sp.]
MQTSRSPLPCLLARTLRSVVASLLALAAGASVAQEVRTNMLGFSAARAADQLALEKKFDVLLDPADQQAWLELMSAEPNHVGSPHNKANAGFMLEKFREWGWDAQIETFYVLYPTPMKQTLELVAPVRFTARLHEPLLEGDRTSGKTKDALPPYHAYGADGDVTGELVYVNQGMPDDYKELDRRGIGVKGRIVIARYGGGWRGLKPKLAYEHGAIGCIIYSDPRDDGYSAGDIYPKGGWRPPEGVQRGSVADMPIYPGDPLTPNVGATKDAQRLSIEDAKTVLKIPVMPISYADARPLLDALGGPVAPAGWRGALPITYHIGPGPAKVHLAITSDWSIKPIYNVIATIKGSELPDQWVIRGNHHDGWVFGAWDPLSANVALMAEAKAIGALVKQGWRPKRTLVYASWDGEEPGLLGSTEWVETHADELRRKAVLYVNSDSNGRGFLGAAGSHSWQTLVNQAAADVRDPQTGVSVLERLRARILVEGNVKAADEEKRRIARQVSAGQAFPIDALGSGSDFSPFLQHIGIASLDIGFGGEDKSDGIYHSVYDSFDHYLRFGDPGFVYGVALAQTIGRVMLRVADADVLPMRFTDFANTVAQYADELHKVADDMRERTQQQHRLLDGNAFKLAADPTEMNMPPGRESSVPFLNFAPLDNALSRIKASAKACDEACTKFTGSDFKLSAAQIARLNELFQGMEQTLIHGQGLPGREWYRHMIYAPGLYTGYGAKTLPGVREAIEQRHWLEVDQYMAIIGGVLNAYGDRLDLATAAFKN